MQVQDLAPFSDISQETASYLDVSWTGQEVIRIALGKDEIMIGRDDTCGVHLPLSNVSWNHSRLTCNAEEYIIEDLDSTNGTYVNNISVSRCVLRNGDQVRIGDASIVFVQQKVRDPS